LEEFDKAVVVVIVGGGGAAAVLFVLLNAGYEVLKRKGAKLNKQNC